MTMRILAVLFFLAFGLLSPLVHHRAGSLSFTLFDLAEWLSLLPAERGASPALILSFILRLQIVVALMLVISLMTIRNRQRYQLFALGLILLTATAQMPPLDILAHPDDINYRQQLFIAVASLLGGWLAYRFSHHHYAKLLMLGFTLLAASLFWLALHYVQLNLAQYQMSAHFGAAAPALLLAYVLALACLILTKRAPQRSFFTC